MNFCNVCEKEIRFDSQKNQWYHHLISDCPGAASGRANDNSHIPAEDERVKRLLAEVRQDIAETSPNSSPMGVFRQHCEDLLQVIDGLSAVQPAASTPTGNAPTCNSSCARWVHHGDRRQYDPEKPCTCGAHLSIFPAPATRAPTERCTCDHFEHKDTGECLTCGMFCGQVNSTMDETATLRLMVRALAEYLETDQILSAVSGMGIINDNTRTLIQSIVGAAADVSTYRSRCCDARVIIGSNGSVACSRCHADCWTNLLTPAAGGNKPCVSCHCFSSMSDGKMIEGCGCGCHRPPESPRSPRKESRMTSTSEISNQQDREVQEQARQLVEKQLGAAGSSPIYQTAGRLIEQLINDVASFAAEAATQGQAAMAGRAVEAIREWEGHQRTAANNTSYLDGYRERMAEHADAADEIRSIVESLSPDPNYLDRVRAEAATAAVEQAAGKCNEQQIGLGEWKEMQARWKVMDRREVWNDAVTHCADVIADVGDDKE